MFEGYNRKKTSRRESRHRVWANQVGVWLTSVTLDVNIMTRKVMNICACQQHGCSNHWCGRDTTAFQFVFRKRFVVADFEKKKCTTCSCNFCAGYKRVLQSLTKARCAFCFCMSKLVTTRLQRAQWNWKCEIIYRGAQQTTYITLLNKNHLLVNNKNNLKYCDRNFYFLILQT